MYPPSSIMTPEPDPDCVCEGLAGTPRVRIVTTDERTLATTAGTERVFSEEEPGAAFEAAQPGSGAKDMTSISRRRTKTRVRLGGGIDSAPFSHNSLVRKSRTKKWDEEAAPHPVTNPSILLFY
jgi:hypothetical protein